MNYDSNRPLGSSESPLPWLLISAFFLVAYLDSIEWLPSWLLEKNHMLVSGGIMLGAMCLIITAILFLRRRADRLQTERAHKQAEAFALTIGGVWAVGAFLAVCFFFWIILLFLLPRALFDTNQGIINTALATGASLSIGAMYFWLRRTGHGNARPTIAETGGLALAALMDIARLALHWCMAAAFSVIALQLWLERHGLIESAEWLRTHLWIFILIVAGGLPIPVVYAFQRSNYSLPPADRFRDAVKPVSHAGTLVMIAAVISLFTVAVILH